MKKFFEYMFWTLIFAWISTGVFNAIWEIYDKGGFWTLLMWVLTFALMSLWVFTMMSALKVKWDYEKLLEKALKDNEGLR